MSRVTTRLATADDVPAIARLHAEGWESFRTFLPEAVWRPRTEERRRREWHAALEQRDVILAEEDGRALGFVSVWDNELSTFFVTSEARGRGIGCRLLTDGAGRLAGRGVDAVLMRTFADGPVRSLFDRLGGEVAGTGARDYDGVEVAEVTYRWAPRRLQRAALCHRLGVTPQPPEHGTKLGVARNVKSDLWPLNGLRHPPEAGTNGWYLWAGQEPSHDPDYFLPLHVEHLDDWRAGLAPYLALPPGWRVLLAPGYEDAWFDESLLDVT